MKLDQSINILFYTRMKVGIYCRVSTNFDSQKLSIEHQIEGLRKLVDENPCWEYVDTFVDVSSGLNINKQLQLQLLKKRCLLEKINLIVFKDLTRFSRNIIDTLIFIRDLINHGITFYCVLGSFFYYQEFNNELLITLMSAMAQEEVRNVSRSIIWGYERRFEQGIKPYRTKCFGYEYDNFGKLVINKNEAEVIRYIFNEFLKGGTIYSIAKQVSKLGVNTVKGNKNWNPNTINYILKNTLYAGNMLMPKK